MSPTPDDVTVHQVTCFRCSHTAHVGTRPSALEWALADMGWSTTGLQHLCPDCSDARPCSATPTEDTAVSHADEPQPPIPPEGQPHAYVAVQRTFSVHADRPEWDERTAVVVPEWDHERLDRLPKLGYTLIPIGPDGPAGTRAITEPTVPALRMVEGGLYRNPLGAELRLIEQAYQSTKIRGWQTMVPGLWAATLIDSLTPWLVTAEGLTACGYTLVTEDGSDGE